MASTDPFYKHLDLQIPSENIRLLTVRNGDSKSLLRATLQEVSIHNLPHYMALSYVWGNPTTKKNLLVNGRIMKIQPNVSDALRRLRARHGSFAIWIDAICINQTNPEERATQVLIMRQIYESASLAVVYLGEIDNGSQLQQLFASLYTFSVNFHASTSAEIDWRNLTRYGLSDVESPDWQPFLHFLRHPWFSRVWVFQESLVARKSIFIQGDCSISQVELFFLPSHLGLEASYRTAYRPPWANKREHHGTISPTMCNHQFGPGSGSFSLHSSNLDTSTTHYPVTEELKFPSHRSKGPCVCSLGGFTGSRGPKTRTRLSRRPRGYL
ncbi:heterokaryon incompatibility protein-domain-containing protein [Plectosphaerella cucumerina]|uniref:Heterokaryon incompatibility protein-domain-containing protein n=1 Tax=Plectosphaerella cucumerina TaxID=40658 RepID=A0A8K0TFT7_9PEZI|nr:heterokaryon incompatibility protein-domain-containing protein [Plectosphaerella cucumerina]